MFENVINSKKQGDDGSCYSIPTEKIESSGSMNLGDKYSEFKVSLF